MSNKRPLTAEEKAMADRMKAVFEANPQLTQEAVGAAVGVTQGTVWQWIRGEMPVSAKRAPALAEALGIQDPAEISIAYRDIAPSHGTSRPEFVARSAGGSIQLIENKASHTPRFDLDSIVDAAWALGQAFAAKKLPYHLEDHPEYFLQVYKACLDLVDQDTPGSTAMIFDLANEIAEKAGVVRDARGDSEPITGLHQEDVAGRIRRKRRPKGN